MSLLSRYLDDAYTSWLGSAVTCCTPQSSRDGEQAPLRGVEKPMTILHHEQPQLIPPPLPIPQDGSHTRSSSREWVSRTRSFASKASARSSFAVKRTMNAYNGPRRLQISAPTDFRHVETAIPRRTERFRPLELSIYMPDNQLSPILPHFGGDEELRDSIVSSPPALAHVRSESALSSFSITRKPVGSGSFSGRMERISKERISYVPGSPSAEELMAALKDELPSEPAQARIRSNTLPARMLHADSSRVAKVKSIMQENVELEKRLRDIDSIIEERQSVYMSSRAGSLYAPSEEPMPDMTTSELEQMPRPKTAPNPIVRIPLRAKSFTEASSAFEREEIPPPPLPLVLQTARPPLRKKKSFSRVSSWLFPAEHSRNVSMDSVTNTPKPVTTREGFYQCVDPNASTRNASFASASSIETPESDMERTLPTDWSPDSSPRKPRLDLTRTTTFGEDEKEHGDVVVHEFGDEIPHRVSRVGVAF